MRGIGEKILYRQNTVISHPIKKTLANTTAIISKDTRCQLDRAETPDMT